MSLASYSNSDLVLLRERRRRQSMQPKAHPVPDFHAFIRDAWEVVEPATPFVDNWHIGAIAEHLQAVTDGQIRNLLINIPPRSMKSTIVSVVWPVWEWAFRPATRWLYASYALPLSIRDALKSRRVIQSRWYQQRYGDVFKLTGDQNQKSRYENDKTGYRIATSVGAAATGEGGDRLVVDDPHNVKQALSDQMRQSAVDWMDQTWSTRRNDPKKSTRVVVMQRLHEEDVSGHLLEQGGWEHLCLPNEYEPTTQMTVLGWSDPRTEDGDLLWPERFGPDETVAAKLTLGSYGYAGQQQQRPAPRGGGMYKRDWWQRWTALPNLTKVRLYVDSAFKTGVANDYSAIAAWGTDGLGSYYLIDFHKGKYGYPALMQLLHDWHAKYTAMFGPFVGTVPMIIEDKASGQSAIQTLSLPMPVMDGGVLPALPVIPFPADGDERQHELAQLSKEARAESVTPLVQARRVYLPMHADWVEDYMLVLEKFPAVAHDEDVDLTSMPLIDLSGGDAAEATFGPNPFYGFR